MGKRGWVVAFLMMAVLTTSCTVYKFKELDAKSLAAAGKKSTIIDVQTKSGSFNFGEANPASLQAGGVAGNVLGTADIDPNDIVDISPAGKRARVVLGSGTRFQVVSSSATDASIRCEVLTPTWIPLGDIVKAKVRKVNTGMSILASLGGVVLATGALALDAATADEDSIISGPDDSAFFSVIDTWLESGAGSSPRGSVRSLLELKDPSSIAEEEEFWVTEWILVEAKPSEDGKCRVRLENPSGVPRGVDEAKLVVVDHPPGCLVAPDGRGVMHTLRDPLPPAEATDESGQNIASFISAKDGVCWRSPTGNPPAKGKTPALDALTFGFPRPDGARRAKLLVNATNSAWRAEFAREALALPSTKPPAKKRPAVDRETDAVKLRVRLLTAFGWQTGQVIFAAGPIQAADMVYAVDLGDVTGDKVWLKIQPPAGYWLFDRFALDFSEDAPIDQVEVEAEEVDGPNAAEALGALKVEDRSFMRIENVASTATLTFTLPPPKEGMARTLFLKTVDCYVMPPRRPADVRR